MGRIGGPHGVARLNHGFFGAGPGCAGKVSMTAATDSKTLPAQSIALVNTLVKSAIQDARGPLPPTFMLRFLMNEWRRFLVHTHATHGLGTHWVVAVRTTRTLLWSITPSQDADERKSLAEEVSYLVPIVNAAMVAAGTMGTR